jgi:predicted ATPase
MAHIVSFAIENLAGRKGTYAKVLNRDVNIFFGLNGSGKTSLLRILDSAMSSDSTRLEHVPFTKAMVVVHSSDYNQAYTYTIDRTASSEASVNLFDRSMNVVTRRVITSAGEIKLHEEVVGNNWQIHPKLPDRSAGKWRHSYLPVSRMLVGKTRHENRARDDFYDVPFEKELERQWLDFFGTIQAKVQASQQKGLVDILNEVLITREPAETKTSPLDWELAYQQMISFLHRYNPGANASTPEAFKRRFGESGLLRSVIGHIHRVEKEIASAVAPQTKLQELIARLFTGNKRLRFGTTSLEFVTEDATIALRSLSSGEKQILRIFLEALKVGESSLLIDEPELSMHVDWQRELIADMREMNSDAQLILATHSPEIMADVDDGKIFKL